MAYGPKIPLIDNVIWRDIVETYRCEPHCLERGCSQETLVRWVRQVTGRTYPRRRLRRVLLAAVRQGRVEYVADHPWKSFAGKIVDTSSLDQNPASPTERSSLWEYHMITRYKGKIFRKVFFAESYTMAVERASRRGATVIAAVRIRCE